MITECFFVRLLLKSFVNTCLNLSEINFQIVMEEQAEALDISTAEADNSSHQQQKTCKYPQSVICL